VYALSLCAIQAILISIGMSIDTRKITNISNSQTWFLPMYFSVHTLYLFLIIISLGWNAYNTYQYRILAERQTELENILTELLPSSSSIPSFHHESASIERWFDKLVQFIKQLTSKNAIKNNNSNSMVNSYTVSVALSNKKNLYFFRVSYVNEDIFKNQKKKIVCALQVKILNLL
jgi:hypothetical protein